MKNFILIVFIALFSLSAFSQAPKGTPVANANVLTHSYIWYLFDPLQSDPLFCKHMGRIYDSTQWHIYTGKFYLDSAAFFPALTNTKVFTYDPLTLRVGTINLNGYQPLLVSGTNIKTINGQALPGSGNIVIGSTIPTYNYGVSRPVNSTSYTPSTTQPYRVYYSISITCTATIGGTSAGKVELQYFNGITWVGLQSIENSNTVTLAVALQSVTKQTSTISAEVPANTQLRMVSTSTGTTTISYNTGQEVLY